MMEINTQKGQRFQLVYEPLWHVEWKGLHANHRVCFLFADCSVCKIDQQVFRTYERHLFSGNLNYKKMFILTL